jgi:hypothetical protein
MTDEPQQQTPPPAPPANATEASNRLGALVADKDWSARLMAGHSETTAEFHSLTAMVAEGGDDIDVAMSGALVNVKAMDARPV